MDDKDKKTGQVSLDIFDDFPPEIVKKYAEVDLNVEDYYVINKSKDNTLEKSAQNLYNFLGVIGGLSENIKTTLQKESVYVDNKPNPVYLTALKSLLKNEQQVEQEYKTFFSNFSIIQKLKKNVADDISEIKDLVKQQYLESQAKTLVVDQEVAGVSVKKEVPLPKIEGLTVTNRKYFQYPENEGEIPAEVEFFQAANPDNPTKFSTRKLVLDKKGIEALLKEVPELASQLHIFPSVKTSVTIYKDRLAKFIDKITVENKEDKGEQPGS